MIREGDLKITKSRNIFRFKEFINQSPVRYGILIVDTVLEVIVSVDQIAGTMNTQGTNEWEENNT